MQLFLAGAGTPVPTATRFGTCQVLKLGEDHLMFDCGPAATYKLVKMGLRPTQIDNLFLTHHHYDHSIDLPCFLLTRWNLSTGRERLLSVWGPPPLVSIIERLIGPEGAFALDWKARTQHPGSLEFYAHAGGAGPRPAPEVHARELQPGATVDGDGWLVTAALAQHQEPYLQTLAYRVDSDEGSIVFANDTEACETVARLARGAGTLVVTCWDHQHRMTGRGVTSVMGTLDVARFAREAGVKRLVLTHTLPALDRPGSRERAITDIGRIYDGEIIFGQELVAYDLKT